MSDLDISTQPVDSRINGINLIFNEQDHTLGNLLQSLITEIYLDSGRADSPISFVGYKIRHPLYRVMTLTLGFKDSVPGDSAARAAIAREIVTEAATNAVTLFNQLDTSWKDITGMSVRGAAATLEERNVAAEG